MGRRPSEWTEESLPGQRLVALNARWVVAEGKSPLAWGVHGSHKDRTQSAGTGTGAAGGAGVSKSWWQEGKRPDGQKEEEEAAAVAGWPVPVRWGGARAGYSWLGVATQWPDGRGDTSAAGLEEDPGATASLVQDRMRGPGLHATPLARLEGLRATPLRWGFLVGLAKAVAENR